MMAKFAFSAGIAVRYYGTITVEADDIDKAKAMIQQPTFSMSEAFSPNGGGKDDVDFDYHKPAVHLFGVLIDDTVEMDLEEDLPDPPEGL